MSYDLHDLLLKARGLFNELIYALGRERIEEDGMSVVVIIKVPGDTAQARQVFQDKAEEMKAIAQAAKSAGALRHRFAASENEIVVVDEWETVAGFQQFFSNPKLAAFMAEAGAQGPPEIEFYEVLETADAF